MVNGKWYGTACIHAAVAWHSLMQYEAASRAKEVAKQMEAATSTARTHAGRGSPVVTVGWTALSSGIPSDGTNIAKNRSGPRPKMGISFRG